MIWRLITHKKTQEILDFITVVGLIKIKIPAWSLKAIIAVSLIDYLAILVK